MFPSNYVQEINEDIPPALPSRANTNNKSLDGDKLKREEKEREESQKILKIKERETERQKKEMFRLELEKLGQDNIIKQKQEETFVESVNIKNKEDVINKKTSDIKATVVYDYEPQESNEIKLIENEIVYDIIKLDEGWYL